MPPYVRGMARINVVWLDAKDSFWIYVPVDCTMAVVQSRAEQARLDRHDKDWLRLSVCIGSRICDPAELASRYGLADGGSISVLCHDRREVPVSAPEDGWGGSASV